MKILLICILICLVLIVPSNSTTSCLIFPLRCGLGMCCVQNGNSGTCEPLLREGERCALQKLKNPRNSHIYYNECPCAGNLHCVADNSGNPTQGTCVPN